MNRRWICNDVWMDLFPFFDHAQLGLKLALLSPRFNALVDTHFDGKSEFTIWRPIEIRKDTDAEVPKLFVFIDEANSMPFPLLDRPLPSKIRFHYLHISYIDHFVIAFLRVNQQIFDRRGIDLHLWVPSTYTTDGQPIWDIFVRELWPILSSNIHRLGFIGDDPLDHLLPLTSPTMLTDLNQLDSLDSSWLLPEAISGDFDRPNATAGELLSKWLHTPRKDGQPKKLRCCDDSTSASKTVEWVNNFKTKFLCAMISSGSYKIQFFVHAPPTSMVPFELANDRTQEKLTLTKASNYDGIRRWIMKRCPIGETAAIQWDNINWDNLNNIEFWPSNCCIGPLSPPPAEEEEAGQSSEKRASSDNE